MNKQLIILTGPPGAGKDRYSRTLAGTVTVYSQDYRNKAKWRDHNDDTLAILITAAPDRRAKAYWLGEARKFGFTPRLIVLDPGRAETSQRLLSRAERTGEAFRRRQMKTVQRWYKEYSPHADETTVVE